MTPPLDYGAEQTPIEQVDYSQLLFWIEMVEKELRRNPELDHNQKIGACPYTVEQIVTEALRRLGWRIPYHED